MSCILRIAGTDLNLKDLLKASLIPDSTWEKGAPRFSSKPDGEKNTNSGVRYLVSEAEFDEFAQQKLDAIEFLKMNNNQIQEIMNLPNIDEGVLDFGIYWRNVPVQCDNFSSELVRLAGILGLGIGLTQYPLDEDDEAGSEQSLPADARSSRLTPETL